MGNEEREYEASKIPFLDSVRCGIRGLLTWPEYEIEEWILPLVIDLNTNPKSLVMTERPIHYVAAVAIPEPLKGSLARPQLRRLTWAVEDAILGDQPCSLEALSRLDWPAARARVNVLLQPYGHRLAD